MGLASKCDSLYRLCIHLLGLQVVSLIHDISTSEEGEICSLVLRLKLESYCKYFLFE